MLTGLRRDRPRPLRQLARPLRRLPGETLRPRSREERTRPGITTRGIARVDPPALRFAQIIHTRWIRIGCRDARLPAQRPDEALIRAVQLAVVPLDRRHQTLLLIAGLGRITDVGRLR